MAHNGRWDVNFVWRHQVKARNIDTLQWRHMFTVKTYGWKIGPSKRIYLDRTKQLLVHAHDLSRIRTRDPNV
jgi:hypothetical protein